MKLDSLVRQDAVQVDSGDQSSHLSKPHPYQYSHYMIHHDLPYIRAGLRPAHPSKKVFSTLSRRNRTRLPLTSNLELQQRTPRTKLFGGKRKAGARSPGPCNS